MRILSECPQGVSRENSSLSPWTQLAKFKLKGEKELSGIDGLNYVIVRPAIIYGVGDRQGISESGMFRLLSITKLYSHSCVRNLQGPCQVGLFPDGQQSEH